MKWKSIRKNDKWIGNFTEFILIPSCIEMRVFKVNYFIHFILLCSIAIKLIHKIIYFNSPIQLILFSLLQTSTIILLLPLLIVQSLSHKPNKSTIDSSTKSSSSSKKLSSSSGAAGNPFAQNKIPLSDQCFCKLEGGQWFKE